MGKRGEGNLRFVPVCFSVVFLPAFGTHGTCVVTGPGEQTRAISAQGLAVDMSDGRWCVGVWDRLDCLVGIGNSRVFS